MLEDPILEALWKRVLERWDERSPHDAFLSACHERELLGEAAARYRAVAEGREVPSGDEQLAEARREQARKRLGAVSLLAMQSLEATRQPRTPTTPRWLVAVAAIATVAAFAWLLWVLST